MIINYFDLLQACVALFVITDPLGNLPIFMGLTENLNNKERLQQFNNAVFFALILIFIFTFFGSFVLSIFHITLRDFKIAGGILLLVITINLLVRSNRPVPETIDEVGIFPLGCPLLVGPGAITTAMLLIGTLGWLITSIAIVINFILVFIILFFGEIFYERIGGRFFKAVSRIMLIFLAAIAVQLISDGIIELVKIMS